MKYNVRVRIIDPYKRAIHEEQVIEADSGLEAMHKAQALEKNTSRGLVQCNGADPLPPDPEADGANENAPAHEPHKIAAEPYDYPPAPKTKAPKGQTKPVP